MTLKSVLLASALLGISSSPVLSSQSMGAPVEDRTLAPACGTANYACDVYRVQKGDSLSYLFRERGLAPGVLLRVLRSGEAAESLHRLKPGQTLRFMRDETGQLLELVFEKDPVESVRIHAHEEGFKAQLERKSVDTQIANLAGTIQSSLFVDGGKAGLSDRQVMELVDIFRWDIDFALEIRPGDQFRVLFEEKLLDGEKWRNGPILAAEFINKGKRYQAFRYQDKQGRVAYFNADGYSKRRAFTRSPLRFARVSSGFSKSRWHPILKRWRSHKGVDYAAPIGTPIKATGQGRVIFQGWKKGYGRVVILEHARKYQTLYAHMSRFAKKVKVGRRVEQGQVVGYVGKSGLASGPHVHYEFRVNGVHRNPLTIKLPKSLRLSRAKLTHFKRETKPLITQLAAIESSTMIASNATD